MRGKASGVPTAHDERDDRRARLRADGWVAADLVAAVCARLGADPRDLSDGRRTAPATAARAVIAHVACDGAGLTGEAVAELVGVTGVAVSLARRRGRSVLAVHGWSVDEVLSWRPAGS